MTTTDLAATPEPDKDATADEIVADIERTRAQLGDSVNALAVKLDVKTQAKNKVQDVKSTATQTVTDVRQSLVDRIQQVKNGQTVADLRSQPAVPAVIVGTIVAVAVGVFVWRRQR